MNPETSAGPSKPVNGKLALLRIPALRQALIIGVAGSIISVLLFCESHRLDGQAWIMLLLGLNFTASLAAYLVVTNRQNSRFQSLLEQSAREADEHRANEERFRLLIENAPDAIVALDHAGAFTSANPFFQTLTGWPQVEWLGHPFLSFVHHDDVAQVSEMITAALNADKVAMAAFRLRTRHGEYLSMEFTVATLHQHGRISGVLAIGRDVSERHRVANAQVEMETKLRRGQKMEALGRLAGGIAHDFNNFLAVIMGSSGLTRMDLPATHPALKNMDQIDRASQRAATLVRQILTFSRRQDQEKSVIHLKPVFEEALNMLRSTLPSAVEIRPQFSRDCPPVSADAGSIQQVILNLANNSAHALGEAGGVLDISLAPIEVDANLASRNPDLRPGSYVLFIISDDGCGMDATTQERIFEPFFTTKPAGEGTGLGLSMVHGIVKSHDGAISVYSEVGRGTSFKIYLPAANETEVAAAEAAVLPVKHGNGQRILFVDDEKDLAECGRRILEGIGYQVTAIHSTAEAVRVIRNEARNFDALVTDYSMPGMNGLEIAREWRRLQPTAPVILMSGFGNAINHDAIQQHKIYEMILKPFTMQALAEIMHAALTTKSSL
jgi:PAS domain S-box-containing protein